MAGRLNGPCADAVDDSAPLPANRLPYWPPLAPVSSGMRKLIHMDERIAKPLDTIQSFNFPLCMDFTAYSSMASTGGVPQNPPKGVLWNQHAKRGNPACRFNLLCLRTRVMDVIDRKRRQGGLSASSKPIIASWSRDALRS